MNDRELLELAAKAAGIVGKWVEHYGSGDYYYRGNTEGVFYSAEGGVGLVWNPLTDDGDALRLAVKLRIDVCHNHSADHQLWVLAERAGVEGCFAPACCVEDEFEEGGRDDATRRAIVRAAAEIGKAMP